MHAAPLPARPTRRSPLGYTVIGTADIHGTVFAFPVVWTEGEGEGGAPITPARCGSRVNLVSEPPQLWEDTLGKSIYGPQPLQRTDLINTTTELFETLADRILEVRGVNWVPRVEAVTIDARTGPGIANMELMSTAAPEKPSRYRLRLAVDERPIFDRMCLCLRGPALHRPRRVDAANQLRHRRMGRRHSRRVMALAVETPARDDMSLRTNDDKLVGARWLKSDGTGVVITAAVLTLQFDLPATEYDEDGLPLPAELEVHVVDSTTVADPDGWIDPANLATGTVLVTIPPRHLGRLRRSAPGSGTSSPTVKASTAASSVAGSPVEEGVST